MNPSVMVGKTPYAAAFARLGRIRSAGVTDLRYGNLMDEYWQGRDRFAHASNTRRAVPAPVVVACYAIAATTAALPGGVRAGRQARGQRPRPPQRPRAAARISGRSAMGGL